MSAEPGEFLGRDERTGERQRTDPRRRPRRGVAQDSTSNGAPPAEKSEMRSVSPASTRGAASPSVA